MAVALEKFRALTRVFDPIYRPYSNAQDGPGSSYVAEAHEDYRRQMEASLLLNDNAKLLIAGQPGCGKTTLLLSIVQQLRSQGRVAVVVDLESQTAVQDLGLVEMHLAATAELLATTAPTGVAVSMETLNACADWIAEVEGKEGVRPALQPAPLAAELRRMLVAARESPELRRALRLAIGRRGDGDPHGLLGRVLSDLQAGRPVIVFDGLDKLLPEEAKDFFLNEKRKPMTDTPCAVILTIPLSVVYEPGFNVLSERYNNADSAVLPAIRLYEFDSDRKMPAPLEAGFKLLRRIVEARVAPIDPKIMEIDAIDRAIAGSGGNIRELARLLQSSIVKALVRGGERIEQQDVEAAIADQRESFRRAWQDRFLPVLQRVRDECRLDNTDDIGKLLLYGLWVVEYRNGITWYSLPVPVRKLLDQIEGA